MISNSETMVEESYHMYLQKWMLTSKQCFKKSYFKKMSVFIIDAFVAMKNQIFSNPNYELLREQVLRLQSDTKLFNAKAETIQRRNAGPQKDHKIDLNVQNMEINDLNEKVTELLTEFNKFRDSSIIIKKDDGIGTG